MGSRRKLQQAIDASLEDVIAPAAPSLSRRTLRVRTLRLKVMSESEDNSDDDAYFTKQTKKFKIDEDDHSSDDEGKVLKKTSSSKRVIPRQGKAQAVAEAQGKKGRPLKQQKKMFKRAQARRGRGSAIDEEDDESMGELNDEEEQGEEEMVLTKTRQKSSRNVPRAEYFEKEEEDYNESEHNGQDKRIKTDHLDEENENGIEEEEEEENEEDQAAEEEEDDFDSDDKANKVQRDEVYNLSETDANESYCFMCRDIGRLICCENCQKTFHLACVNLKKPPQGVWECPYCREEEKNKCCSCQKTVESEGDDIVVTCSLCYRLMHFACLGIPLKQLIDCPMNRNHFLDAQTLNLLRSVTEETDGTTSKQSSLETAVKQLHKNAGKQVMYTCFTCISYFSIDKIEDKVVTESGELCYIVKLKNASYIHCYWLNESEVHRIVPRKLKNYKEKKRLNEKPAKSKKNKEYDEDEGEAEEIIVEETDEATDPFEGNIQMERIIDCKRPVKYASTSYREIYEIMFGKSSLTYDQSVVYGGKSNFKFFIKWKGMFYEDSTFEDEFIVLKYKNIIKAYFEIKIIEESLGTPRYVEELTKRRQLPVQPPRKYKTQPGFITGGSLHKFQIDGVGWLCNSYNQQNNVILADEMGLGKTVQSVSFLNYLFYEKQLEGPFLIVTPSSTLYNWLREFSIWGDKLNALVYAGNQISRSLIRQREFFYKLKNKKGKVTKKPELIPKFHALITSYDTAINDMHFLRQIKWDCLIVDEAHRLKNNESKFFKIASTIQTKHKVLLTGTPLQNNIMELLNLIEFICPSKAKTMKSYESLKVFVQSTNVSQSGGKGAGEEVIPEEERMKALNELTSMLGPHLLRRKKTDVDLDLPEMEEIIVKISLTDTQKYYYKNVLVRNYDNLKLLDNKAKSSFAKISLLNILMSLRLVCNHPFLFLFKKKYELPSRENFQTEFVDCSNKLKFLERMIPKLLAQNHKMLIFSQFTMMLDILGQFFNFRGWTFERLDGTTSVIERQRMIDSFNQKDSKPKIFLLSTRAGGLGINLTSADTIFFTDSDFNPYRDVQAISRAYRMGQEAKVKVYRLVSKFSAEERIIEIATRKLLLESIIINPINKLTKEDFETILKNGTYEMFNKNLEEKDQEFTDDQIDALLSRDGMEKAKSGEVENVQLRKSDLNDYYLSGFKFNSYNFETVDERPNQQERKGEEGNNEKKYWETLLDDQAKALQFQTVSELGKGKRVRKTIKSTLHDDQKQSSDSQSEFDADGHQNEPKSISEDSEGNDEVPENYNGNPIIKKQQQQPQQPSQQQQDKRQKEEVLSKTLRRTSDKIMKYFEEEVFVRVAKFNIEEQQLMNGFNEIQRMHFLSFVLEFGMDFTSIELFWQDLLKYKSSAFKIQSKQAFTDFKKFLTEFYASLFFFKRLEKAENPIFCGLSPENIVRRITGLSIVRKKCLSFTKKPEKFKIHHKEYNPHVARVDESTNRVEFEPNKWTNYDDYLLLTSAFSVGFGNWQLLLNTPVLWDIPIIYAAVPFWQIIFQKFDEKEQIDFTQIDKQMAIAWVIQRIDSRANNIINFLFDSDEKEKD